MKHLTHREMQTLLNGVAALHTDHDPASLPSRIFSAVKCVAAAEIVAVDWFHPRGWWLQKSWLEPAGSITPDELQIFGRYAPEHPLYQEFLRTGLSVPRKISDFATTRQFRRLGIYNEFYSKVGVDRQLSKGLAISSTLTLLIALSRSRKDFTESNRRLLAALEPHLLAAHHNAEAFAQVQLLLAQLQTAIEESGSAVVIVSLDGRVRLMSGQAGALCTKYFAPSRGHASDLPEELARWLRHHAQKAPPAEDAAPPVPPLEVVRGDSRLRVRLLTNKAAEQHVLLLEEEYIVIPERLLETLGLTRREAEVLRWVAQGKTNPETAELCYISVRTVQKHLEHIYQKLGVESRTAAARQALEALRRRF